ncbi:MAG: hypothetical protein KDE35_17280, partial [Geminicoccaceae bacterium]|nr:hypothetical protein [Geminicoccaceae bacterium]
MARAATATREKPSRERPIRQVSGKGAGGKGGGPAEGGWALDELLVGSAPLRRLLTAAKGKGGVSFDELNKALPDEVTPEQIDDLITALERRGITVSRDDTRAADGETGGDGGESGDDAEQKASSDDDESDGAVTIAEQDLGRTDDPVRM